MSSLKPAPLPTVDCRLQVVNGAGRQWRHDTLAVEAPLCISVVAGNSTADPGPISITMRTPGHDAELAVGFLFGEGIIAVAEEVVGVAELEPDGVQVRLKDLTAFETRGLQRNFYTTSACGVCGKTSIDALEPKPHYGIAAALPQLTADLIHTLPERLRAAQASFEATGAVHAAGLFDPSGALSTLREDVGRHNAFDKMVGAELLAGRIPANQGIAVVSGRASFELVQKAVMAGIGVFVAVGAPSSSALSLAHKHGVTLVGFARDGRYNLYCGQERIRLGG